MKKFSERVKTLKVGDVFKTKDDKYYLVGDINKLGGVCDDCMFDEDTEIHVIGNIVFDLRPYRIWRDYQRQKEMK